MQTKDITAVEVKPEQLYHDDNKIAPKQAMSATEIRSKVYEPKIYNKAINDPIHGRQWKETIEDEIQNLENDYTWEYDNLPLGRKAVRSKWVFRVKYHPDGTIAQYKTRLVVQSFSQIYKIDFNDTFLPTMTKELLRIFLAIFCQLKLIVK